MIQMPKLPGYVVPVAITKEGEKDHKEMGGYLIKGKGAKIGTVNLKMGTYNSQKFKGQNRTL